MSESDELPSWAATAGQPGGIPPARRRRWRRVLLLALAAVSAAGALGGMAVLGYWFAQTRDETETDASGGLDPTREDFDDSLNSLSAEAATSTTLDTASDAVSTSTSTPGSSSPADPGAANRDGDDPNGPDGDTESVRHAIYRDSQVILQGKVPSQEVADQIAAAAGAVVGPENVVVEYEIDPDVALDTPSPLFVEDAVLFAFNSVEIEADFLPILDLGTLLLEQNPDVTITVVTTADATGSEEVNLEVSEQRAQAVIDYWVRQGIEPDRLFSDARGEVGASGDGDSSDDRTSEAAAFDRRAEFVIEGLLG